MDKKLFLVQLGTGIFFIFILLLPSQIGIHFWPKFSFVYGIRVDYLSPTVYLTDILTVFLIFLFFKDKTSVSFKIWFIQFFCYLLATSALLSVNQGSAFYKLLKIVEFLILGIVLYQTHYFKEIVLKQALSLAVIFTSLLGLAQLFKGASLGLWFLGERQISLATIGIAKIQITNFEFLRPYATFSHPNSLAGFVLVSLLILSPFKLKTEKIALFLGIIIIFLSWSQTVWLVSSIFVLCFYLKKKTSFCSTKNLIIVALLFLLSLSPILLSLISNSQEILTRKELLDSSFKMIKQNFALGLGLNNFVPSLPLYLTSREYWLLQPVHNVYLLVATEIGLVGIVLLGWGLRLVSLKPIFSSAAFWAILLTGSLDHYWLTLQQNQLLLVVVLVYSLRTKKLHSL